MTANDNVVYWPKNNSNSHIQQWNVQIEQAIDSKTSFQLAYVGTHMSNRHPLQRQRERSSPSSVPATNWFPSGGTINPNGVGAINEYAMIGSGNYNGLQTKLTRRMSNGLTGTVAYTWSHTLDNAASSLGGPGGIVVGPNGTPLLNYQDGNANDDQRQLFAASAIYELPFGRGKRLGGDIPKTADYVIGGWQWNNVIIKATGTPIDISGAPSTANGQMAAGLSRWMPYRRLRLCLARVSDRGVHRSRGAHRHSSQKRLSWPRNIHLGHFGIQGLQRDPTGEDRIARPGI